MSELKPCPMCGSKLTTTTEEFIFLFQTKCIFNCYGCGFTLTARTTRKATRTWNSIPRRKEGRTMRDRLIELTKQNTTEFINPFAYEYGDSAEQFDDHLLANGVTVQEWISVKDRLPEDGENVLCYESGKLYIAFCEDYEENVVWWDYVAYDRDDTWNEVCPTHWMPLPPAPKGE